MKVRITNSRFFIANRILNISIITFGSFLILFIILVILLEIEASAYLFMICIIGCSISLLTTVVALVMKLAFTTSIEIDLNKVSELIINTRKEIRQISKYQDLEYRGNKVKLILQNKPIAITNKHAFLLLKNHNNIPISKTSIVPKFLDTSPKTNLKGLFEIIKDFS